MNKSKDKDIWAKFLWMDRWDWAQSMWIFVSHIGFPQKVHAIDEHWTADTQKCPSVTSVSSIFPTPGPARGPRGRAVMGDDMEDMQSSVKMTLVTLQSFFHWRVFDLPAAEINSWVLNMVSPLEALSQLLGSKLIATCPLTLEATLMYSYSDWCRFWLGFLVPVCSASVRAHKLHSLLLSAPE